MAWPRLRQHHPRRRDDSGNSLQASHCVQRKALWTAASQHARTAHDIRLPSHLLGRMERGGKLATTLPRSHPRSSRRDARLRGNQHAQHRLAPTLSRASGENCSALQGQPGHAGAHSRIRAHVETAIARWNLALTPVLGGDVQSARGHVHACKCHVLEG
jgi:hypothetical protein